MAKKTRKKPASISTKQKKRGNPLWKKGETPPGAKPFQPGQSGNPKGRASAGTTLREHINAFSVSDLTETQLRKIARDPDVGWTRRTAAVRVLRSMEDPDLADFQAVVRGETSIEDMRKAGVNTSVIKKLKPTEFGLEIELHDRSGDDFDRISDRTDGRPIARVEVKNDNTLKTAADGVSAAASLLADVQKKLGIEPGTTH